MRARSRSIWGALLLCVVAALPATAGAATARLRGPVPRVLTPGPIPPTTPAAPTQLRSALRAASPASACTPQTDPTTDFASGCYPKLLNQFLSDVGQASQAGLHATPPVAPSNVYGVTQQYGDVGTGNPPPASGRSYSFDPTQDTIVIHDAWPADIQHGNAVGCQYSGGKYNTVYNWCLTDAQVQTELRSVLVKQSWPADANSAYFVMLPPGIDECAASFIETPGANQCADTDFCAYHSNFTDAGGNPVAPLYAVVPWPDVQGCRTGQSPNGDPAGDFGANLISHEHNEVATDPLGSGWYATGGGAQDESGDKCIKTYSPTIAVANGGAYNQIINSDNYFLQDEFANADGTGPGFPACEGKPGGGPDTFGANSGGHPGSPPASGTTAMSLHALPGQPSTMSSVHAYTIFWDGHAGSPPTASVASAPAAVHRGDTAGFQAATASDPQGQTPTYTWSFGDGEIASGQTATHVYGVSGIYTVTLTVSDADGYQSSQSRTIRVYGPPVASFTTYPAPVIAGTPIDFNSAASADSDGAITAWSWLFGDGTGASGPRVNHAYAKPGVYSATLTLTDSNASSASETASVTVLARGLPSLTGSGTPRTARAGSRVLLFLGRTLGCPPGPTPCTVTVSVSTVRRLVARTAGGHRRTITRNVSVASTGLSAGAGSRTTLSLALNPTGQALLRRLRRLTLTVHIIVRVTGSPTVSRAISATVSDPPLSARRR